MQIRANGVDVCTSGWSVERTYSTALTGVSTAAHCDSVDYISQPSHVHALDFVDQHLGSWGDVEWHTSAKPEPDNFYASETAVRDVASVEQTAGFSVGEYICVYGRATNDPFCGLQVEDVSLSCTIGGVTVSRLVEMDGDATSPGDSGAPWYYGTKAYGSHMGICSGHSTFSKAANYDSAINVRVRR